MSGDMDLNGDLVPRGDQPGPGQKCPTCDRRVNHPKKADSPNSRVRSYRLPVDEADAHKEILTEAAKFLGAYERPHWEFQTLTIALALVLQDEKLRGFAQRRAA